MGLLGVWGAEGTAFEARREIHRGEGRQKPQRNLEATFLISILKLSKEMAFIASPVKSHVLYPISHIYPNIMCLQCKISPSNRSWAAFCFRPAPDFCRPRSGWSQCWRGGSSPIGSWGSNAATASATAPPASLSSRGGCFFSSFLIGTGYDRRPLKEKIAFWGSA